MFENMIRLNRAIRTQCNVINCDVSADWSCPDCGKNWCVACCYMNGHRFACRSCVLYTMPESEMPVDEWEAANEVHEAQRPPAQPADDEDELLDIFYCAGCKKLMNGENASGGCRACNLKLFKCKVQIRQLLCNVCNACLPTLEATRIHRRSCEFEEAWHED